MGKKVIFNLNISGKNGCTIFFSFHTITLETVFNHKFWDTNMKSIDKALAASKRTIDQAKEDACLFARGKLKISMMDLCAIKDRLADHHEISPITDKSGNPLKWSEVYSRLETAFREANKNRPDERDMLVHN
ncbi:MAG: hypothetical protein AABP62_10395 [Planctomycetota bacterium]